MSQACYKREACAVIVDTNGKIAVGQNLIYAEGVTECPRTEGEGYEKCKSICNQAGHAETEAIKQAKLRNLELNGANLYLTGHYRICDDCKSACDNEGINVIIVSEDGR